MRVVLVTLLVLGSVLIGGVSPASSAPAGLGTTMKVPGLGTISVDQTKNLVNQVVHVSWSGFKPSSENQVSDATMYPVRVYECKGTNPTGPEDCYGSSLFGGAGGIPLPDGPTNAQDAVTSAKGKGGVDLEVRTAVQSPSLGCNIATACSIVVVPNYGDPTIPALDFLYAVVGQIDKPFAWARHVAIPIAFAPTRDNCPLGQSDFSVAGSPEAARVITQWQPGMCTATPAVNVDYTALGEPSARQSVMNKQTDVALTTEPAAGADTTRAVGYAPIAISGIAISFRVDDANTGQPITSMRLTPLLLAKLITQSYGLSGFVARGSAVGQGNPATVGNPQSIFVDPDFLRLNPGHAWPSGGSTPLLMSDNSDLTHALTAWIASDKVARAFLNGLPDHWGMHVNTNYVGIQYPADEYELRDNYAAFTYIFAPVAGLDTVARGLVTNQPPGVSPQRYPDGTHPKLPAEPSGSRDLIAIADTANADAFRFPMAALETSGGRFITPTADSMAAAVTETHADLVGALPPPAVLQNAAAYPLTMVQAAMVPTAGIPAAKAAKIADFLQFAAGPGQQPGVSPGQLPVGYLPLPATLAARTRSVAATVAAQNGKLVKLPDPAPSPVVTTAPPPAPVDTPATQEPVATPDLGEAPVSTPAPEPTHKAAIPTPRVAPVKRPSPSASPTVVDVMLRSSSKDAGTNRLFLPLVLVFGLAAAVFGTVLATGATGHIRRVGGLWSAIGIDRARQAIAARRSGGPRR